MLESTTSLVFPDVNVWLALTYQRHVHHVLAHDWFDDEPDALRYFCRFTQLGLLRLLSTAAVMRGEVMTQVEAWRTYDHLLGDDRVAFLEEPVGVEGRFRLETRLRHPAPKDWADSYLVEFAAASGPTLLQVDR